jgi:cytidylate kinase
MKEIKNKIYATLFLSIFVLQNIFAAAPSNAYALRQLSTSSIASKGIVVELKERLNTPLEKTSSAGKTRIDIVGFISPAQPQLSLTTALYVLSGNLKAHFGNQVNVVTHDMYADHNIKIDSILNSIIRNNTKLLCLSIVPGTLEYAKELYEKLKAALPPDKRPTIVLGNAVPNYMPETILRKYFPDAVIGFGEGELTLIELAEYKMGTRSLDQVHNIAYLEENEIIYTERKAGNLEEFAGVDIEAAVKASRNGAKVYIEASRGCPWSACLFCASRDLLGSRQKDRRWRPREVENVLKEIEALALNGVESFYFADEEFIGPGISGLEHIEKIAKGMIGIYERTGKRVYFNISCRADAIWEEDDKEGLNPRRMEALKLLKRAGLNKIFLGVESGSQSQLDRFNKGLKVAESEKAIVIVRDELGINLEVGFIMFDPEVTIAEVRESIDFIERNNLLPSISSFMNALRIQAGTPFAKKYRQARYAAVNLSAEPDPNTLQYSYSFLHNDIREIYSLVNIYESTSVRFYYVLKSIMRAGINNISKEEYQIYIKYKNRLQNLYLDSLKQITGLAQQSSSTEKARRKNALIIEIMLKQLYLAAELEAELRAFGYAKCPLLPELIEASTELKQAAHKILSDSIIQAKPETTTDIGFANLVNGDAKTTNSMIFVLKPGGTFNRPLIMDVLKRISNGAYSIEAIRILTGTEIAERNIFEREHGYAFKVARQGEKEFTGQDKARLKEIYDNSQLEEEFSIAFDKLDIIPAYGLIDSYGLSEAEVAALWESGYGTEETYMSGAIAGINKVGSRKYVLVTHHPSVNNGRPFMMVNGMCIQMKHLIEKEDDYAVAFLLRQVPGAPSISWKEMREYFLGDRFPHQSPIGSIRRDAFMGKMDITEPVPFWKNVAHLSSGPFEGLLEEVLWFDLPIPVTPLGKELLGRGYTEEEISYFLTDPYMTIGDVTRTLFDLTEKVDIKEAIEFLEKVSPPFYNKYAMPTITFTEFLRYQELHDSGRMSVADNIIEASRLRPSAHKVKDYPASGTQDYQSYAERGNSLIRQGKVAQVFLGGGTAGRWFGYDVPEERRIRFLADAYEVDGRMRSFAELKIANILWTARNTGGHIPLWVLTSSLSNVSISDFLAANSYFGMQRNDVHFFVQGGVPRFNPTRNDLKADSPKATDEELAAVVAQNGSGHGLFRFSNGSVSTKPMGHFDAIASLILSKELLNMVDHGIEYVHFSDATNLGTIIDPVILGMLESSDKSLMHILAVKNLIYTINIEGDKNVYEVVTRDGKVINSTLPKGIRPVFDSTELVGIAEKGADRLIKCSIDRKLEKGGTLAEVDGSSQIVEGFRFPKDFNQARIPYFSTAHQIVKVEGLFKLLGLTVEEYRNASEQQLYGKISQVAARLNTYLETKKVLGESGDIRIAVQLSRLSGDLTSVMPTEYVIIDRDGVNSRCGFIPFKAKEDMALNERPTMQVLGTRAIFADSREFLGSESVCSRLGIERLEFNKQNLLKILNAPNPADSINEIYRESLLDELIPPVAAIAGLKQGTLTSVEPDTFEHTLGVLRNIRIDAPLPLKLAALFHDIGKKSTQKIAKDGSITFFGHERASAEIVEPILKELGFAGDVLEDTLWLIRNHQFKGRLEQGVMTNDRTHPMTIDEIRYVISDSRFNLLVELTEADIKGAFMFNPQLLSKMLGILERFKIHMRVASDVFSEKTEALNAVIEDKPVYAESLLALTLPDAKHLPNTITIDGLSASGKSTTAKALAAEYGYVHIEYSSLYRAVAYIALINNIQATEPDKILTAIDNSGLYIKIEGNRACIMLQEEDITEKLYGGGQLERTITATAPDFSSMSRVRTKAIALMKDAAGYALQSGKKLVITGRVAGKEILPNADLKIFMDVSLDERINRIAQERYDGNMDIARYALTARDARDIRREESPVSPATGAFIINTTSVDNTETAVRYMMALITGGKTSSAGTTASEAMPILRVVKYKDTIYNQILEAA